MSPRGARPGNFALLALLAVLALTSTVGAITTHLRANVRLAADGGGMALARLQAVYLAEMGINDVLFAANLDPAAPWGLHAPVAIDFKQEVAMVRDDPAGVATVVVQPAPADGDRPPLEARATLVCAAGTFRQVVYFDVGRAATPPPGGLAPQWTLARYRVDRLGGAP